MSDVLTDLRALLALEWETLVYAPEDGWMEAAISAQDDAFMGVVERLTEEAEEAWHDDAGSTREMMAVPQRRLDLEWHTGEVDDDGDPVRDWADGVVVEHPDLLATMAAAAEEIERLRAGRHRLAGLLLAVADRLDGPGSVPMFEAVAGALGCVHTHASVSHALRALALGASDV